MKFSRYKFNGSANDIIINDNFKHIIYIHIGKCAGTSTRDALLIARPKDVWIHEFHCYDSPKKLREILDIFSKQDKYTRQKILLITTLRDPIKRFFSAFKWGLEGKLFQQA